MVGGYRYQSVDYDRGGALYDVANAGFLLGFKFGVQRLDVASGTIPVNARQADADIRAGWRIAVVDDDPGVRRSLTRLLRASGFDVLTFESAEEFLKGTPTSVRCVVLDVQLGGQTGLDLYDQLEECGRVVPVVFITSHEEYLGAPPSSDRRALLRKPFEAPDLIEAIRRVVSAAEADG